MSKECTYVDTIDKLHKTIYNQDQKIADLEAKLAEKDESHHKNIVELTKMATEKDRMIEELKQQLAEKEKKYQDAEKCAIEYQNQNTLLEQEIEHLRSCLEFATEQMKKDKISFAVEQLEKVKEFLAKRKDDYLYLKDEIKAISYNQYVDFVNEVEIFELKVDNQIKAIKGEK